MGRTAARLIVRTVGGEPWEFTLGDRHVTIGRDPGCELVLESRYVSRRHVRLEPHGSAWALVELASSNPVEVNGDKVRGIRLLDSGDLVRIADVTLEFHQESSLAPEVTAILQLEDTELAAIGRERLRAQFGELEWTIMVTELKRLREVLKRIGESRLGEFLRVYEGVFRTQLTSEGAIWLAGKGGSGLGIFADGPRAVRCAIHVQDWLARYNYEHPSLPIVAAVAIDTGSILSEDNSLALAASRAIDTLDGCSSGEVLISEEVHRILATSPVSEQHGIEMTPRLAGRSGRVTYSVAWRRDAGWPA